MKKLFLLLILSYSFSLNAQVILYEFCFDQSGNCYNYSMSDPEPILTIDTITNLNNIWQIGPPQKQLLSSSKSLPNALITDTISSYPINDTSSFTIESTAIQASSSVNWSNFYLSFDYYVDADTLTDYGLIEFSGDNGATWIDLINDPSYANYVEWDISGSIGIKPCLTGRTNNWVEARVNMHDLVTHLDIQPGSIFKWRFTFISDAIQNNRDGLMYDNIMLEITAPIGLQENDLSPIKKLIKVVDLLGIESEIQSNRPLIYQYEDGSIEKVFIIEK